MGADAHSATRRAIVVANPISGRGRGARAAEELARGFTRRGIEVELLFTRARGDAPRLLASARPADLVIAVGGDGTLSEVLLGLHARATPVGLLPCGTANVLARALRLPRDPERALEVYLRGRTQGIDVARVGARLAHLVVGIGFDGRAVHAVEERRRGPITKAAYVGGFLRALARHKAVPLQVWLDGEELAQPVGMVWIANTAKYADLLNLSLETRLDDGSWEVYLFPTGSMPELLGAGLRGLVARLPGGGVSLRRARHVRVEAPEPVPCQIDGDHGGETPLVLELLEERFRILVP